MSKILCIDTTTDICSVAITEDGVVTEFIDSGSERSHAKMLAVFIDQVLKIKALAVSDLDAIAISMGPGSYTGLRIGVSTAKGLCYASGKPLIAVSTLEAMCYGVDQKFIDKCNSSDFYFCPLLDARRMEVYTAMYDNHINMFSEIQALVVDSESFTQVLDQKPVIFFGSGAEKIMSVIDHKNSIFYNEYYHSAKFMAQLALKKMVSTDFEDVAYFEPYYLKDFVATVPKKKVLGGL